MNLKLLKYPDPRLEGKILTWWALVVALGILSGFSVSIFLWGLDWCTKFRLAHVEIIYFLPISGLMTGIVFRRLAKGDSGGVGTIIHEIHGPKRWLSPISGPIVLVGTWLTHLYGGSAGREGTAVQLGAHFAEFISRRCFELDSRERRVLLMAGAGAGFSAAIGTPIAGAIFGLEFIQVFGLKLRGALECLLASTVAFLVTQFVGAPHSFFSMPHEIPFGPSVLGVVLISAVCFGLVAYLSVWVFHWSEILISKSLVNPVWRLFWGGSAVICMYIAMGSFRYSGLGVEVIQESLKGWSNIWDPIAKLISTAVTIGSGFKGGEFIPLVFIGATTGSQLAYWVPNLLGAEFLPGVILLPYLGFVAVFGAASNTPLTCSVMAVELFGWEIGPYALLACTIASVTSGSLSIYKNQIVNTPWWDNLRHRFGKN